MTALWQELDRKLTLILSGKSPLLNEGAPQLSPNTFFFTSGPAYYSMRAGAPVRGGTQYDVIPYEHSVFTNTASALTVVSQDDNKRIVTTSAVPVSAWNAMGYATAQPTPFFDRSLQAHKLNGYYIQTGEWPEKKFDYALAEIIIEGPTAITIRREWDKYKFFRFHNLTPATCTVTFDGDASFTIAPYGCKCYRRSGVGGIYTAGFNYFFPFAAGDPRTFRADFSPHVANNVANPSLLFDVVAQLQTTSLRAWWQVTPQFDDATADYAALYGDPNNDATKLGDVLHHRGKVIVARTSGGVTTFTDVQFDGYSSIVSVFAAAGVTVSENAAGDLQFLATDPAVTTDLIAIGTNLFKRQNNVPAFVSVNTAYAVESLSLNASFAPNFASLSSASYTVTEGVPVLASGTAYYLASGSPTPAAPLHAHSTTVGQLKQLMSAASGGATLTGQITQRGLAFTASQSFTWASYPGGPFLLGGIHGIETFSGTEFTVQRFPNIESTALTAEGNITIEDMGWPNGSEFISPRIGRYFGTPLTDGFSPDYRNEASGVDGADFSLNPLAGAATTIKRQEPLSKDATRANGQRFLTYTEPDCLREFLANYQTAGWYQTHRARLLRNEPGDGFVRMPLLREHYNQMSAQVNGITRGVPLNWTALVLLVGSPSPRVAQLATNQSGFFASSISPRNQFARLFLYDDNDMVAEKLGIPKKGYSDLPVSVKNAWTLTGPFPGYRLLEFADALGGFYGQNLEDYRWITYDDVKTAIEALGFTFAHAEITKPISLTNFNFRFVLPSVFGGNNTIASLPQFTFARTGNAWEYKTPSLYTHGEDVVTLPSGTVFNAVADMSGERSEPAKFGGFNTFEIPWQRVLEARFVSSGLISFGLTGNCWLFPAHYFSFTASHLPSFVSAPSGNPIAVNKSPDGYTLMSGISLIAHKRYAVTFEGEFLNLS